MGLHERIVASVNHRVLLIVAIATIARAIKHLFDKRVFDEASLTPDVRLA